MSARPAGTVRDRGSRWRRRRGWSGSTSHGRLRVGIVGTGNIGTDLVLKVLRSPLLDCTLFVGRNLDSAGMRRAASLGVPVSDGRIDGMQCSLFCIPDGTDAGVTCDSCADDAGQCPMGCRPVG